MKVMKLVRHWYQQDQKYKKTIKLQFAKGLSVNGSSKRGRQMNRNDSSVSPKFYL